MKNIKIRNIEISVRKLLILVLFCISLSLITKYIFAYKKIIIEDEINKQTEMQLDNQLRMRGLSLYLGDDEIYRFVRVYGGNLFFKNDIDSKFYSMSSFLLGEIPVTNRLYEYVMTGIDVAAQEKENEKLLEKYYPVAADSKTNKDWLEFIEKLSEKTGHKFRLPTLDEWEYAARGGKESRGFKYAGSDNIDDVAVYKGNNNSRLPLRCKQKKANEIGLYDMSGLVDEITSLRWFEFKPKRLAYKDNPEMKKTLYQHVARGGNAISSAKDCLLKSNEERMSDCCGARLVLER